MDQSRAGTAPAPGQSRRTLLVRVRVPVMVFAGALAVALLAAPIPTHTWQATAVTGTIGLLAMVLVVVGYPRRAGRGTRATARATAPWIALALALTGLEIAALAAGSRPEFPTVSHLLGPQFVDPAVRLAGYVAWLCTGYWLVRR